MEHSETQMNQYLPAAKSANVLRRNQKMERKYLVGHYKKRGLKNRDGETVDMEWVYKQLDDGRTVIDVANELQISRSTLRRRHLEYQESLKSSNE